MVWKLIDPYDCNIKLSDPVTVSLFAVCIVTCAHYWTIHLFILSNHDSVYRTLAAMVNLISWPPAFFLHTTFQYVLANTCLRDCSKASVIHDMANK